MAWTSLGSIATGTTKTAQNSAGTLTLTNSVAVTTGDVVVLMVAIDNNTTTDTTFSGYGVSNLTNANWKGSGTITNQFTYVTGGCNSQAALLGGSEIHLCYTLIQSNTVAAASAATITIFNSIGGAMAASLWAFRPSTGTINVDPFPAPLYNDGADPGSMSISGLTNIEHLYIRAIAAETSTTTMTATSGFTAIPGVATAGGSSTTNMRVAGEYRILTGTSATSDPTVAAADCASVFVAFHETISTPVATPQTYGYMLG